MAAAAEGLRTGGDGGVMEVRPGPAAGQMRDSDSRQLQSSTAVSLLAEKLGESLAGLQSWKEATLELFC